MDEVTLSTILINDPFCQNVFKGTFPANEILKQTYTFPAAYIINTANSYSHGKHWFVIFLEKKCKNKIHAHIFDSLGGNLNKLSEAMKISLFGMSVSKNTHQYQGFTSNSCGLFCLYYIKLRCRGFSNLATLNTLYKNDFLRNERIIKEFILTPYLKTYK